MTSSTTIGPEIAEQEPRLELNRDQKLEVVSYVGMFKLIKMSIPAILARRPPNITRQDVEVLGEFCEAVYKHSADGIVQAAEQSTRHGRDTLFNSLNYLGLLTTGLPALTPAVQIALWTEFNTVPEERQAAYTNFGITEFTDRLPEIINFMLNNRVVPNVLGGTSIFEELTRQRPEISVWCDDTMGY